MIEKSLNGYCTKGAWMLLAMENDELTDPVAISRFGVGAEVTPATDHRNLIKQA